MTSTIVSYPSQAPARYGLPWIVCGETEFVIERLQVLLRNQSTFILAGPVQSGKHHAIAYVSGLLSVNCWVGEVVADEFPSLPKQKKLQPQEGNIATCWIAGVPHKSEVTSNHVGEILWIPSPGYERRRGIVEDVLQQSHAIASEEGVEALAQTGLQDLDTMVRATLHAIQLAKLLRTPIDALLVHECLQG